MSTSSPTNILADNLLSDEEHQSLDIKTVDEMHLRNIAKPGKQFLEYVVQHIVGAAPSNAQLRPLSLKETQRILMDERVFEIVEKGVQNKTFRNVRNLVALRRTLPVPGPDVGTSTAAGDDQDGRKATIDSWKIPYIGKAHKALYATMSDVCRKSAYARLLAVVQSSGMGESRMIDELSKEHFVIPINLRTTGTGFPPGDHVVSRFLQVYAPLNFSPEDASCRAQAFLISLFEATAKIIPNLDRKLERVIAKMLPADRPTSNAEKFRLFMTLGQSCSQHGTLRQSFYNEVIRRAEHILKLPEASSINIDMDSRIIGFIEEGKPLSVIASAYNLVKALTTRELLESKPLIILAYDEAHQLIFPKNEDKPGASTAYSQHQQVIRELRILPIFALFLSTSGKVHGPAPWPPPVYHSSDRLMHCAYRLPAPFSAVGFDQMVGAHSFTGAGFGINDVSRVGYMVVYGRPLWGSHYKNGSLYDKRNIVEFAEHELMQGEDLKNLSSSAKLALISVRLALEFNTQTTEGRAHEMEQVEKYMRVCIQKDSETTVTISPSEPLLAEAARHHMTAAYSSRFNMPASLLEHLTTMGLHKRDRGKLVAQVILTLAADKACKEYLATARKQLSTATVGSQHQPLEMPSVATVPRAFSVELFIKALLEQQWHDDVLRSLPAKWRTKTESNCEFQTVFKDTRIYFTHFIRLDDPGVVNREFLWRLAIRGCVALCADGQGGIDIIAPLVFGTETLCRSNVSALFVQVKNDKNFTAQPNTILFDLMDPYSIRFFDMDETKPLPIIRMVFALGSPTAAVEAIPQYEERLPRETTTAAHNAVQRYTSYDIWCAKASPETFGVINKEDEQNYSLLLKNEKVFPQAYRSEFGIEEIEIMRRSMNPGTAVNEAHWSSFCGDNMPQLPTVDLADSVDFGEEDHEFEE